MSKNSPAYRLANTNVIGSKTGRTWKIREKIGKDPLGSGGNFCVQYLAEGDDGSSAFVKACDISLLGRDPSKSALQVITEAFNQQSHERNVLDLCFGKNLDKIVVAYDYGEFETKEDGIIDYVFFIIFEKAESDSRSALLNGRRESLSWILQVSHDIAVGVSQLHGAKVAHNDIKPSNILCFADSYQKIADLGRATTTQFAGPWDGLSYAGDPGYKPPEFWGYDHQINRFENRVEFNARASCDIYHVGSMLIFLLTETNAKSSVSNLLQPEYWPDNFGGTYRDVLPHIQVAHAIYLEQTQDMIRERYRLQSPVALELLAVASPLLDPDPVERGDPSNRMRGLSQFDLQRTISRIDLLAKRLAIR